MLQRSYAPIALQKIQFHGDLCLSISFLFTEETDQEVLKLLMENIKNLTSYVLKAFTQNSILDESSDDDSEIEITDIVIVPPSHTSRAKFVSKLRKFAKNHFDIIEAIKPEVEIPKSPPISTPPKAVVVQSPIKSENILKVSKTAKSKIMINGNNVRRDQVVKATLKPSLTCPFKPKNSELKFTDFVVKLEELPQKVLSAENKKKKSCRCGNATPAPGKLTCGGQRCPCYISSKACVNCKCKGCRNPHQVNGIKVIRPHLTPMNGQQQISKYMVSTMTTPFVPSQNSSSLTTIRRIQLN